ncbi:hypothetical protein MRX96_027384 [Rhipicephalus microplus]
MHRLWCSLCRQLVHHFEIESDYFYGQLGYRSLKANRYQSFVIVKTLQETKGNAYGFKRTMKDMFTRLFEGFGCFGVAADAGRRLRVHTSSFRSTSMLDWLRTTKHQFNERARMRFHCLRTDIFYEQNRPDERNVWKNLHLPDFGSARSCVAESPEDSEKSADFLESEEVLDTAGATSVPSYA